MPPPLFCRASRRSSSRSGPWLPATRQEALEVSRCEARTSETRSPRVALITAMIAASSASGFVSSLLSSSSGIRPKSISPWLSDFSGLPSKSSGAEVQNASTGSVSSSTSMPRAAADSSFGFDFSRSMLSPTRKYTSVWFGLRSAMYCFSDRFSPAVTGEARQRQQFLAPLEILVEAFLDDRAEGVPDLREILRILVAEAFEFADDPRGHGLPDLRQLRIVLQHLAGNVERQVLAVDHAADEAQIGRQADRRRR